MSSIGIKVRKMTSEEELTRSRFFGTPVIIEEWSDDFFDDEIFFCQINLSELEAFTLPEGMKKDGYLYIFLHTDGGVFTPDVRYCDGPLRLAVDCFNEVVDGYENLTEDYVMEFFESEDDYDGTRLFGVPSNPEGISLNKELFMQFDPIDTELGFLNGVDGYFYLFFGEDKNDISKFTAMLVRS